MRKVLILLFLLTFTQSIQAIQYDLAFPGMLPDHPLFKLKVLRDRISLAFIKDPIEKIQFHLLQADKGILGTAMLLDKGNIALANQTALKAQHHITLITYLLPTANLKKDSLLLTKIKTASKKHQEVLGVLIQRLPLESQQTMKTVYEFSTRNLYSIEQLEKELL